MRGRRWRCMRGGRGWRSMRQKKMEGYEGEGGGV